MNSTLMFARSIVGNIGAPVHNVFGESLDLTDAQSEEIQFSDDPLSTILISGNPENCQDSEAECSGLELTPTQYNMYAVNDGPYSP